MIPLATRPLGDVSKYVSCIHCGMCTSSCPTYLELGSEADSPRGRIHLMRAVSEGRLELTRDVVHHLELCLDCQACVTACPSGVPYGQLIEDAKEHIERARLRPLRHRVLLRVLRDWLFPYPKRIRAAMSPLRLAAKIPGFLPLLERLPFGVGKMVQLVPPSYLQRGAASLDEEELRRQMDDGFVPAVGEPKGRVALLRGCIGSVLFADVNVATAYVLARNGYDVIIPKGQGCCGSLHLHTGARETARRHARALLDAFAAACAPGDHVFASFDAILVNAAGCGSAMKHYGELFGDDSRANAFSAKVRDVSEFLAERTLEPPGPLPATVTYHDACHLLHGQGVFSEPRQLLAQIPGLRLVPLEESHICCGSAGVYNIMQQDMGERLLERKIAHIEATGAHIVATGNSGCALQIAVGIRRRGLNVRVVHPIELLYAAYKGEHADN